MPNAYLGLYFTQSINLFADNVGLVAHQIFDWQVLS